MIGGGKGEENPLRKTSNDIQVWILHLMLAFFARIKHDKLKNFIFENYSTSRFSGTLNEEVEFLEYLWIMRMSNSIETLIDILIPNQ